MSSLVYRIHQLLLQVVGQVGTGTNLALFLLLWTFLSGRLLESRGGVIPALSLFGLPDEAVRRCWAALAYGQWSIAELTEAFGREVCSEGRWQPHCYGGFRPVAGDVTAFFRPTLKGCPTKHYCAEAGKALPAIPVGLLATVGIVGSQRLALPVSFLRADPSDPSERSLQLRLLQAAKVRLEADEAGVFDRGFPLKDVLSVGPERFVVRLPKNFTARRASPPSYQGIGRPPKRGEKVRPLPRSYNGRVLSATPPDRKETWIASTSAGELELQAEYWDDLVLPEANLSDPQTRGIL